MSDRPPARDDAASEAGATSPDRQPLLDRQAPSAQRTPPHRLVRGTAAVEDLDAFLEALDGIADETGAVVQAFDASLVVSGAHLREAVRLAARAIARDEAVARDPGVEILLYAAGRRQIDRALQLGVSEGERRIVVLVADFGDVPGADRPDADVDAAVEAVRETVFSAGASDELVAVEADADAETFDCDPDRVRDAFDITDREVAATAGGLADIVLERVALLDVEK
ncbi:KEOPS complex Cgi121-like subunit [Halorubrum aidingense JCM 13560]|uniref:KEOPS complex Cgi121-like subunit n=1 Tax=Halorubrum aidingense JCM 13560 TaxID=1230454 RepID=M0PBB2_9EURY|nr:KEOPS complex subunit Cgi121 [Halorubrum aidingense]EMA66100.1 KEOPS complex Cgi121-like subunit [Halorubrum aidingense JCM 13560]